MDITTYALLKAYVKQSIANIEGFEKGKSAYEIAVDEGFVGTEAEWLKSLQGKTPYIGENGHWFVDTLDTGVLAAPNLDGGAIYITGGSFTMSNGTFDNNTAEESGGAIYVVDGNADIESGTITNNIALDKGGAIAVTSGNIVIGIKECHDAGESSTHIHPVIENNIALEGGGLFINGGTTIMYCGKVRNNHTYEKTVNVYVANGDFKYNGGQIGINYDTGVFINGGEFKDESNEGKVKHELHYKNSLNGDIYNYKIPPSKWMASPKGDILSVVETDSTSLTWKDKFPEYEFVGWEDGGLINDKVYMLIANFEKK